MNHAILAYLFLRMIWQVFSM